MEDRLFDFVPLNDERNPSKELFIIPGLAEIYTNPANGDPISGGVMLLKSKKHPGYCRLFLGFTDVDYSSNDIEFRLTPVFTKDGDAIFLKTVKESRNAVFDGSRKKMDKSDENDWKLVDQPAILGYSDDSICDDSKWFN